MTAPHDKAALRAALNTRRRREGEELPKAAEALAFRFPEALAPATGAVAAGYVPVRGEISPGPLMARLSGAGARLALPVTGAAGAPLVFRAWSWGEPLEPGAFGIPVPVAGAELVAPDLLLVPLLGFDHAGRRLGWGKGYYDATLASLRARASVLAIGLAYEVQRVWALPEEAHDQRLDWIITEAAAYEAVRD